ncbi:MAG: hypothetical protein U0840_02510 [Gemmataceae bacterium]
MGILRRYLVVIALMFWQGGFTFYVSVVVPVATEVLGSALRQGFITRQVTGWLNLIGSITLGLLAVDIFLTRDPSRWRLASRTGLWALMVACQVLLYRTHDYLSGLMVDRGLIVHEPVAFYQAHRVYLWAHTVQWGAGLVFVLLMLIGWKREDQRKVSA